MGNMPKIQNINSSSNGICHLPSQSIKIIGYFFYDMVKIDTFDGVGFWKNAYGHQRGKLLKKVNVPDDQIIELVNKKYMELPAPLRYEIETSGINKKDLL
jgi:hypothetical protein